MTCPNSDPNFNLILKSLFGNDSPDLRKKVFYGICIPTRIILYSAIFYFRDIPILQAVVGIAALITTIRLISSLQAPGNQWWSKRWQFFISVVLVIVCAATYMQKMNSIVMPLVLFLSVVVGFIQSFFINFC